MSGARSGARATGQAISAIDIADISIRALREEGDRKGSGTAFADGAISIHALREEGDPGAAPADGRQNISIHALREEGDVQLGAFVLLDHLFLSTPSARRATTICLWTSHIFTNFYPRPPRGGRLCG